MKVSTYILGAMGTNCYFLSSDGDDGNNNVAIVDPGADFEKIKAKLEEKNLKCTHILLTHGHFDHIMALEELRRYTGAPVYIHEDDADMLTDNNLNCMKLFTPHTHDISAADELLHDGQTLDLGFGTLEVMHTPGHTPGSVCYDGGDFILCGDTLFRDNIGRYDLPGGDFMKELASLKKLRDFPGDRKIYSGHGASSTLSRERQQNFYLK